MKDEHGPSFSPLRCFDTEMRDAREAEGRTEKAQKVHFGYVLSATCRCPDLPRIGKGICGANYVAVVRRKHLSPLYRGARGEKFLPSRSPGDGSRGKSSLPEKHSGRLRRN